MNLSLSLSSLFFSMLLCSAVCVLYINGDIDANCEYIIQCKIISNRLFYFFLTHANSMRYGSIAATAVFFKYFSSFFSGGRFCSFSPCIEQTQRCCEALQENGFVEIQSMEILQIEEQIKTKSIPVLELEFLKYKVRETAFSG